jgi:hypothetical protein
VYTSAGAEDAFNLKFVQCTQSMPVPDAATLPDTVAACAIETLAPPTATEFCLGTITGVPDVSFPFSTIGTTTITWTYDAGNGFVSTQTQSVTITDATAPQPALASLPDVTAVCSVSALTPPSATDNCSGTVTVTGNANFPILANTTVTWTYDDGHGNTTTQTQNVVISPIDNTVTQVNAITLSAAASGYTYQWLDCANGNTPVNGATAQTFTAGANGSYAVQVSNGTCTVVSNCVTISDVGLSEAEVEDLVNVYPNPSGDGAFTVELPAAVGETAVVVTNELGQAVAIEKVPSPNGWSIAIAGAPGMYYLQLTGAHGEWHRCLIKQ